MYLVVWLTVSILPILASAKKKSELKFLEEPREIYYVGKSAPTVQLRCRIENARSGFFKCNNEWSEDSVNSRLVQNGVRQILVLEKTLAQYQLDEFNKSIKVDGQDQDFWCACQGWSNGGDDTIISRKALVKAAYMDKMFVWEPMPTTAVLGKSIEIRCLPPDGDPRPTVSWLKNGITLKPLNGSRVSISNEGSLLLSEVHLSDQGNYTCVAESQPAGARLLSDTVPLSVYVNRGWTSWSDWSACRSSTESTTDEQQKAEEWCGEGLQTRSRTCLNPPTINNALGCDGFPEQTITCYKPCELMASPTRIARTSTTKMNSGNGSKAAVKSMYEWSRWSSWSMECNHDCMRYRKRVCMHLLDKAAIRNMHSGSGGKQSPLMPFEIIEISEKNAEQQKMCPGVSIEYSNCSFYCEKITTESNEIRSDSKDSSLFVQYVVVGTLTCSFIMLAMIFVTLFIQKWMKKRKEKREGTCTIDEERHLKDNASTLTTTLSNSDHQHQYPALAKMLLLEQQTRVTQAGDSTQLPIYYTLQQDHHLFMDEQQQQQSNHLATETTSLLLQQAPPSLLQAAPILKCDKKAVAFGKRHHHPHSSCSSSSVSCDDCCCAYCATSTSLSSSNVMQRLAYKHKAAAPKLQHHHNCHCSGSAPAFVSGASSSNTDIYSFNMSMLGGLLEVPKYAFHAFIPDECISQKLSLGIVTKPLLPSATSAATINNKSSQLYLKPHQTLLTPVFYFSCSSCTDNNNSSPIIVGIDHSALSPAESWDISIYFKREAAASFEEIPNAFSKDMYAHLMQENNHTNKKSLLLMTSPTLQGTYVVAGRPKEQQASKEMRFALLELPHQQQLKVFLLQDTRAAIELVNDAMAKESAGPGVLQMPPRRFTLTYDCTSAKSLVQFELNRSSANYYNIMTLSELWNTTKYYIDLTIPIGSEGSFFELTARLLDQDKLLFSYTTASPDAKQSTIDDCCYSSVSVSPHFVPLKTRELLNDYVTKCFKTGNNINNVLFNDWTQFTSELVKIKNTYFEANKKNAFELMLSLWLMINLTTSKQ